MEKEEGIVVNDETSGEEYEKAVEETDAFDEKIDKAIDEGKYTDDELGVELEKAGC